METRELEVVVQARDGAVVMTLIGDLESSAEAALDAAYARATEQATGTVVLDFAATGYINSTGIALIVGLLAQARRDRIEVHATGLSAHYREIFEITRLSDFMTIDD